MEYVAAGDVAADGVHMLSTGGMLKSPRAEHAARDGPRAGERGATREAVVATEIGMLYPLRMAAPEVEFIPANAEATLRFMKMITLPKLRDALRDGRSEVRVDAETRGAGAGADRPHGRDRVAAVRE